jgi:hypothetical protein
MAKIIPLFDKWWGETFRKVPASGMLRWSGNAYWIYGDLVPPESFPFLVEAKNHREMVADDFLRKDYKQCKLTWYWYHQAIPDSIRATTDLGISIYPFLVYQTYREPNRIVLQESLFSRLPSDKKQCLSHLTASIPNATPFVIVDLKAFFQHVSRADVEKHFLCRE